MKKILGLDLQGTRLGWALLRDDALVRAGVKKLGVYKVNGKRKGTVRNEVFPAYYAKDARDFLENLLNVYEPDVVAYEQVMNHGPGQVVSAHRWGAIEMAVQEVVLTHQNWRLVNERPELVLQPVGVCSAKLALTGSGKATKEEMIAAARARWPDVEVDWDAEDGDAADAAGVAWSVEHPGESKAKKQKREAADRRAARRRA